VYSSMVTRIGYIHQIPQGIKASTALEDVIGRWGREHYDLKTRWRTSILIIYRLSIVISV
jgi:hypothetical protein